MRISDCIQINNCQNLKIIATMLSCYNDGTMDRYSVTLRSHIIDTEKGLPRKTALISSFYSAV